MASNETNEMTGAWPRVRIGDVAEVFDGPHATPSKTQNGPIFLGISSLNRGRLDLSNTEHLSEEEFVKWTRRVTPRAGDVVFSYETRLGEAAIIPAGLRCCLGRRMGLVRTKPSELDPHFFLYQYLSPKFQEFLESRTIHGSTVDRIALKEFPDFEIDLPPLSVQREIAKAMLEIDAKIDVNRRINQTLEAMAQAIFKSWFVDFDPVKAKIAAKAEGRDPLRAAMTAISGKPDAELDTLPPDQFTPLAATAALFPDEMEDSELGEIPKGWQVKTLMQIARFPAGKIDVSSVDTSTYVSTENMLENRGGLCEASSLPSVATVPSFMPGQVLVSNIRPYFKKIWLARFAGGRSNDVLAFQPLDDETSEFLFNLLYQDQFFEFMNRTAKGAKMPRGDKDAIAGWKFVCADSALLHHFSAKVRSSYGLIDSLRQESELLAATRDALMPKLLSGELLVQSIEPEVAA